MLALTAVFLLTALLGVWAAYDRQAAWLRFGLIAAGLLSGLLIVYARHRWGAPALFWAALACALLAALLGAYFLLTYDWRAASGPVKFDAIQRAGLWIQAHRPPFPLLENIHPNVAGNSLVVLLPLAAAAFAAALDRRPRSLVLIAVLALALSVALLALILSASRGSWLGLAAGAAGVLLLASRRLGHLLGRRGWTLVVILGTALACAGFFWAAVTFPGVGRLVGSVTGTGGSASGRAVLWREMLEVFRDYPFTGSGLGSTMLVFSSYVLLLHVGFIGHSHNVFLQVGLEQGLVGILAFAALLGLAAWGVLRAGQADDAAPRDGRPPSHGTPRARSAADADAAAASLFRSAAAATLIVLVISGMTDAGIYVGKAVPVLFIALGFAVAAGQRETPAAQPVETLRHRAVAPLAFCAAVLVLVFVALLPSTAPRCNPTWVPSPRPRQSYPSMNGPSGRSRMLSVARQRLIWPPPWPATAPRWPWILTMSRRTAAWGRSSSRGARTRPPEDT